MCFRFLLVYSYRSFFSLSMTKHFAHARADSSFSLSKQHVLKARELKFIFLKWRADLEDNSLLFFGCEHDNMGFNVTSGGSPKVNKEQRAMQIEGEKVQNYVENMLLNRCGRRFTLFLFGFCPKNQMQTPHSCRRIHLVF